MAALVAQPLTEASPIPEENPGDALHVAIGAVNGVDYVVTWNCTHLASAALRGQIERFLSEAGYQSPANCTPIDENIAVFRAPVVEEVRAIRQRHATRFSNDLAAIVADLKKKQAQLDRPLVSLPAKTTSRQASWFRRKPTAARIRRREKDRRAPWRRTCTQ